MEFIKENWLKLSILFIVIGFGFFWYELKPSLIEEECSEWSFHLAVESKNIEFFDPLYGICMRNGGKENALKIIKKINE